ncbi:MAG: MFS transporter, partial [Candidatus Lokiarchaeota archaeon]
TFFFAISQTISLTFASLMKLKYFKSIPALSLIMIVILLPLVGLNTNYWVFVVLFFLIGFCTGILYGVSLRMILMLNIKRKTSKYSGIVESLIGLGFLIAPIIAGFIAGINLNFTFYILAIFLLILGFLLIYLSIMNVKYIK